MAFVGRGSAVVAGGCSPKGERNKATLALTKPVGESMCIRTHPVGVWTDVVVCEAEFFFLTVASQPTPHQSA